MFIAVAKIDASLEVRTAAPPSLFAKAAIFLKAFIAILAVVTVAPKPSDKLVADLTIIMMFWARFWNAIAAAAAATLVPAPARAATGS